VSSNRIIMGSLAATTVRHAIFAIALPWLVLNRTADMDVMGLASGSPVAGWILIVLGVLLYVRAFSERLRMTVLVTADAGTPGIREDDRRSGDGPSENARPIWSEGVHGWSRNPLLLGILIGLFGACLAFESRALLVYAFMYWFWLTLYLLVAEEPALRRTLGEAYNEYCRQVPRWFLRIPRRKTN